MFTMVAARLEKPEERVNGIAYIRNEIWRKVNISTKGFDTWGCFADLSLFKLTC
jgi:hypothetical protein